MLSTEDRKTIRLEKRRARRELSSKQQKRAALSLAHQLRKAPYFHRAKRIAVYLANDGEIDLSPLIKLCWKLKKSVYLPVLHPVRHNRLWFTNYQSNTQMNQNRYKIWEPKLKRSHTPAWAVDLVLMPLVAFDQRGGRMGMGGGYYDRTFEFTQKKGFMHGPKLIGVAHELQKVEQLPIQSWDVPMHGIATDKGRYMA
jgi:5-formyltetrahydrofolate cyclo-ligase